MKKFLTMFISALLCCGLLCMGAFAIEVPDVNRNGSISVTMTDPDSGKAVPGGTLTLYRVGDVLEDDGNYSFTLSQAFAGSKLSLADPESETLAEKLADYASKHSIRGESKTIGQHGGVVFSSQKAGLFLIVQTKAAEGYEAVNPFLVSLPMQDGESWNYNVNATPKMELLTEKPAENPEKPAPRTDGNAIPTDPSSRLPQTGQLWWPVPVLAVAGLFLFGLGWVRAKKS